MPGYIGRIALLLLLPLPVAAAAPDCVEDGTIVYLDVIGHNNKRQGVQFLGREYGKCVRILTEHGAEYVDWIAKLEAVYQEAERGEIRIETVVAGGHSTGTGFSGVMHGDIEEFDPGWDLNLTDLVRLNARYPEVVSQVRHLFLLGCYTGAKHATREWQAAFSQSMFIMGSETSSPGGSRGVSFMKATYERLHQALSRRPDPATRDRAFCDDLADSLKPLSIVRANTGAFRICSIYYNRKPLPPKEVLEDRYKLGHEVAFLKFYDADEAGFLDVPANRYSSALRDFYNTAHQYLNVTTSPEKVDLVKEKTIRLIYFDRVQQWWWRTHRDDIEAARPYLPVLPATAAELTAMTRRETLDLVNAIQRLSIDDQKWEGEAGEAARRLVRASKRQLHEVHPEHTPFFWVNPLPGQAH